MIRRLLALVPLLLALLAGSAAASPPGPRLAVVKWKLPARTEIFTVDSLGSGRDVLYAANAERVPAVYPFSPPSWSPDGAKVAFTALIGQRTTRYSSSPRTMLALVGADGGPVEAIGGTVDGYAAVFSPDGQSIAFAKDRKRRRPNASGGADTVYESTSIWLVDLATGKRRQLTPWRNRLRQIPSSFSPDGAQLAFTRASGNKPPEALAMEFDGSADTVLARNAIEPVYSPDGGRIAFLRGPVKRQRHEGGSTTARLADLYVRSAGGGGLQRLTRTPNVAEDTPRWDPSGQRLAYTALEPFKSESGFLGFGDAVMEINADGTCATKVLSERLSVHYAATWQPGPGREAGPIVC